jgi:guanylate kinase
VGDTQPIPSPNDAQLKALTVLTERAHRRSRERKKAEEEVNRILNTEGSMMAANQFDYVTQHQLHQMERQLKRLNSVLIEIQDEEAFDAIEEERIWSQIG